MKKTPLVALLGLAMLATAPTVAAAQPMGDDHGRYNQDRDHHDNDRDRYHYGRHDRDRHDYGYHRGGKYRHCYWAWHHHHRERVCEWRRWNRWH